MNFHTPREIYFGWGSAENIEKLQGNSVIVTGSRVWAHVSDFLELEAEVFKLNTKHGEPVEEDVERVANFLKESAPDWIIAVGGGSIIDSAKLAWVFYEKPEIGWRDIYRRNIPPLRNKAKLVAVETTSGTGTGISAAAVVEDKNRVKNGIVSPHFIPDIAVYDPDFVMSMPRDTLIYSGMDALTHAVESYVSNIDNIAADTLSLKAIELIFENIKQSIAGMECARAQMHYANMLAAMGFANSRLGLCHAASHKIGGRYGIAHGKINAILLPHFIRSTSKYTSRYRDIENLLHIEDLASAVEELNRDFRIPLHFPEIKGEIESIADEIMKDPLMNYNPGKMSREEVIDFLRKVAGE